jgi:hypothetical protein
MQPVKDHLDGDLREMFRKADRRLNAYALATLACAPMLLVGLGWLIIHGGNTPWTF